MSVQGTLTVQESDDERYVVGETYDVRLYADRSYDIDNEQAASSVPEGDETAAEDVTETPEDTSDTPAADAPAEDVTEPEGTP